ncbi:MAG: hypothetical protein RL226_1462 [Bacteroidota bacterium]
MQVFPGINATCFLFFFAANSGDVGWVQFNTAGICRGMVECWCEQWAVHIRIPLLIPSCAIANTSQYSIFLKFYPRHTILITPCCHFFVPFPCSKGSTFPVAEDVNDAIVSTDFIQCIQYFMVPKLNPMMCIL